MNKIRPHERLPGRPLAGIGGPFPGLSKVRILDFSKLLPGPYATELLAELGCRVTRVELPYFKDLTRDMPPMIDGVGCVYWMINRRKKVLAFDFRKPAGMRRLHKLIRRSDALLEGFRPGLMDRIGLGYDEVRRINPRLIYCSLSGYDPRGPWGRKAGHDLNFMATSGFLGLGNSDGRLAFPATQLADIAGSLAAAMGILAGLLARGETGPGRRVPISINDALHSSLAIPLAVLRATGRDPSLQPQWWTGAHPFYRLYDTLDGRKLAVASLEKGFAVGLLDALGLSALRDLADDPGAHAARLSSELGRIFKQATLADWQERFKDKDLCVTGVLSLSEAVSFREKGRTGGPATARARRPKETPTGASPARGRRAAAKA